MPASTQRRSSAQRRRRAAGDDDEPPRQQQRRRRVEDEDDDDDSDAAEDENNEDVDMDRSNAESADVRQLVQKLVRYALACEYARIIIRRDGIREKVFGSNASGSKRSTFKRVFDEAQEELSKVFGMRMVELPVREKRTIREKQKAAKRANGKAPSSQQWILISTLPKEYRSQTVIGPSRIPSSADEAAYVAFYTMVISLITLSHGELSDAKLKRYLRRLNADMHLPMDKTEDVMAKLVRQGYLDKIVEKVEGDEDSVTWCVGPRGRVEVSPQNIAEILTEVWTDPPDDFDKKLEKSLGIQRAVRAPGATQAGQAEDGEDEEEDE
ncbi:MAGE-domain-containing protein [Xylariaceae sp. FL0255]|nr:MAGE-domain-containing protein [Xylariaceae sp. FL0255]